MTTLRLVRPGTAVGFLGDLAIPADFYWVAREPVALAGMAYPGRAEWGALAEAGIGHVVCLSHADAPYDATPCRVTAIGLQDLYGGRTPIDPTAERALVSRAVDVVIASIEAGEGVAVHCHGGRGRTGTVLGATLVRLGHDPDEVVDYLHRIHVDRGRKDGWPESPWQSDTVRALAKTRE